MIQETETSAKKWLERSKPYHQRLKNSQDELINDGYDDFFQTLANQPIKTHPHSLGRNGKLSDIHCAVHVPDHSNGLYDFRRFLPSAGATEIAIFDFFDSNRHGFRNRSAQILVQRPINHLDSRLFIDVNKQDYVNGLTCGRSISIEFPTRLHIQYGSMWGIAEHKSWFDESALKEATEFELVGLINALAVSYVVKPDEYLLRELAKYA